MSTRRVRPYRRGGESAAASQSPWIVAAPDSTAHEPRNARRFMSTLPCLSSPHELAHVLGGAASQRGQRITAFERRDHSAFAVLARNRAQLARDPREVAVGEFEAR